MKSSNLSAKQYFMVNLSKFIVEFIGTTVLGLFYLTMGNEQSGMLLGFWIVTLFGQGISGAHYNPAVTLVFMLRKNSTLGTRRLKGIIYIVGQCLGGFVASLLYLTVSGTRNSNIYSRPVVTSGDKEKWFHAMVSEITGTFFFVFLYMLSTDKKTQFSTDKVINCFIIGSAYVASRLMAGGEMVTCVKLSDNEYHHVGPLLNPALALG